MSKKQAIDFIVIGFISAFIFIAIAVAMFWEHNKAEIREKYVCNYEEEYIQGLTQEAYKAGLAEGKRLAKENK
jgi:hypothetical protein